MRGFVLIVEDEPLLGRNLRIFLERNGYRAEHVETVADALARFHAMQPDLVLVDHNLPDGTGLDFIGKVRGEDRFCKLVMLTAHGGVDLAVSAMKAGANDYLTKPVALDEVAILVGKLLEQSRLEGTLSVLRGQQAQDSGLDRILGSAPAIVELKRRIAALARAERSAESAGGQAPPPVLILGETGTGKELVARAIHFDGARSARPFISVNCAALPEQLVESELFGHERGAFTGATEKKIGLIQAADGGTLFLDEAGELPLSQQAKLLRALEEQVIRPVGSVRDRSVNVRFIAATNAEIHERAARGEFRSDLLYRLNAITFEIPPLRSRGDDVLFIAEAMVRESGRRFGRAGLSLAESARDALRHHAWPGNIRELRNVIEQACLLSPRTAIGVADLNLRTPSADLAPSAPEDQGLADVERDLIIRALRSHSGNVSTAAKALGISRDTLRYRMEKHALQRRHYL